MLVLTRKIGQEIVIGDNIKITILRMQGQHVRVGIEAPQDVRVIRAELPRKDEAEVAVTAKPAKPAARREMKLPAAASMNARGGSPLAGHVAGRRGSSRLSGMENPLAVSASAPHSLLRGDTSFATYSLVGNPS